MTPRDPEHTSTPDAGSPARRKRRWRMPAPMAGRSRRARLIARSALAVIIVGVIVGGTYGIMHALSSDDAGRPVVTATAGERTVHVEPFRYCDPKDPTDCDPPGETVELAVSAGTPLRISVPDAITKAPWSLKRYYVDPGVKQSDVDSLIPEEQIFTPGSTHEVTVPPVDDSGRVLAGVEITLPTGIIDSRTQEVTYIDHATWSIRTR